MNLGVIQGKGIQGKGALLKPKAAGAADKDKKKGSKDAKDKEAAQQPQKSMYLFSNIFEKQDDMKNCPFIFEKHQLKSRKENDEYGNVKMKSELIRPRKHSMLHQQVL